jgi:hypothetical protein
MMRTLVRSIPALPGILGTAVLSADVNDKPNATSSGRKRATLKYRRMGGFSFFAFEGWR